MGTSVAEVARKYNVGVSSLIKWRKRSIEGSLMTMNTKEELVPASEVKRLKSEIKQLQQLLGKKTLQVEILQEAIDIGREKKTHIATTLSRRGRYSQRLIATALKVSRSHLNHRLSKEKGMKQRDTLWVIVESLRY